MREVVPLASPEGEAAAQQATALLKEIFSLRNRLKELEEDNKSTITDSTFGGSMDQRESALVNLLKKELIKVENEKASIEKEFMNQLAAMAREQQKRFDEVHAKLQRSEENNKTLYERIRASGNASEEADKLHQRLEDERQRHADEITQLNENIAFADEEIAESRREMDMLHEEIMELQAQREAAYAELSAFKADYEEEKRINEAYRLQLKEFAETGQSASAGHGDRDEVLQKLQDEIGEMNDTIIDLEKKKHALTTEVSALRRELATRIKDKEQMEESLTEDIAELIEKLRQKENQIISFRLKHDFDTSSLQKQLDEKSAEIQQLKEQGGSGNASVDNGDVQKYVKEVERLQAELEAKSLQMAELISPEEKQLLESAVIALEDRLGSFHDKLQQKDKTIEQLNLNLFEERRIKKRLKADLMVARAAKTNVEKPVLEKHNSTSVLFDMKQQISDFHSESSMMSSTTHHVHSQSMQSAMSSEPSSPRSLVDTNGSTHLSSHTSMPPMFPKQQSTQAPLTPVQGMVASFENRIAHSVPRSNSSNVSSDACYVAEVREVKMLLEKERQVCIDLQQQLERERGETKLLQKKLKSEEETVALLQAELENNSKAEAKIAELSEKLMQSQSEAEELRRQADEFELLSHSDDDEILANQAEIQNLKAALAESEKLAEELEDELDQTEEELRDLHNALVEKENSRAELITQLEASEDRVKELKKESEESDSVIQELQQRLLGGHGDMQRLRNMVQQLEKEKSGLETDVLVHREEIQTLNSALVEAQDRIRSLEESLSEKVQQVDLLKNDLQSASDVVAIEEEKKDDERTEVTKLHAELNELQINLEQAMHDLEEAQTLNESLQTALCDEQNIAVAVKKELEEVTKRLQTLTVENESKAQLISIYEGELEDIKDRLATTQISQAELEQRYMVQKKDMESQMLSLREQHAGEVQSKLAELATIQQDLAEKEERLNALKPELDQALQKVHDLHSTNETLRSSLHMEKNATAEANVKLGEVVKRVDSMRAQQRTDELEKDTEIKSYDNELHQLRLQLTSTQLAKEDIEREYANRFKEVDDRLEHIRADTEKALNEKETHVVELQAQLERKEDEVRRLESEKTHLYSNIANAASYRKDEFEDMQAELIDMTSKVAEQTREIQILKGTIEDYEARKDRTEARSRDRVALLEGNLADMQQKISVNGDVDAIKTENKRLREVIRNLKLEKRSLKDRLDSIISDKSTSKSAQVLKERNAALKQEVEKLTKRLQKTQTTVTRFAI
jgi:chromosome segregation ATPase